MKTASGKSIAAAFALITSLATIVLALLSRYVFPYRPRLNHVLVELPRAHKHLDGLTIGFVTDLHVGPHFTKDNAAPITRMLRRAKPDIVLFGGDFISESPRFLQHVQEPLRDMASTAKLGSWGVLGNHDIANIRARVMAMIEPTGIRILENESVKVDTHLGSLWIAGIDDVLLGKSDLRKTFTGVPPDEPCVAMWHEPDQVDEAEPYGPLLILSGHSHGGQVKLPLLGPIAAPQLGRKYVSGRYMIGDMTLFVSNGIGMYRPPVRFNVPPELVLIHLIA